MNNIKNPRSLTIGSKIFVVHKNYSGKLKPGGTVLSARVVAFQNIKGKIVPIFKVAGVDGIHTGYSSVYDWFDDIKLALTAIIS